MGQKFMSLPRRAPWLIFAVAGGVFLFVALVFSFRQAEVKTSVSSSPVANPTAEGQRDVSQAASSPLPAVEAIPKVDTLAEPPAQKPPVIPPDQKALQAHKMMVADLEARLRATTKAYYAGAFRQLRLPQDLQERVIDILTRQQKEWEQQAFENATSGRAPTIPSPAEARAQQAQQNQELRSLLGDSGFAQFDQYRATIPDRMMIDAMNQQGANLSDNQSQQLLQVLTDARRQITGQTSTAQNLDSMSPDQTVTMLQQQQVLLQQVVGDRVRNILTAEQVRTLQTVFSQQGIGPKAK